MLASGMMITVSMMETLHRRSPSPMMTASTRESTRGTVKAVAYAGTVGFVVDWHSGACSWHHGVDRSRVVVIFAELGRCVRCIFVVCVARLVQQLTR